MINYYKVNCLSLCTRQRDEMELFKSKLNTELFFEAFSNQSSKDLYINHDFKEVNQTLFLLFLQTLDFNITTSNCMSIL